MIYITTAKGVISLTHGLKVEILFQVKDLILQRKAFARAMASYNLKKNRTTSIFLNEEYRNHLTIMYSLWQNN